MRSVKDRIMLILESFGKERIHSLFEDESLVFVKGILYNNYQNHNECNHAAKFALTDYSYSSPKCKSDAMTNYFRTPLSTVENDESKILQAYLTDRHSTLYIDENGISRQDFKNKNIEIYKKLLKLGSKDGWRVDIRHDFEEFQGVVSHFYTLIFRFGDCRDFHFKTKTIDLLTDDLFLLSVQQFAKEGFNHQVSIDAIKNDFFTTIDNFPLMLEYKECIQNQCKKFD